MDVKRVAIFGGTGFVGYWMRKTQPLDLQCTYFSGKEYADVDFWKFTHWDYIVFLPHISPTVVLKTAIQCKSRFLYASSGAAYEQQTEYANNKRKWEIECLESGADVVIARLFTFFGKHLDKQKAYTVFTEQARMNKPLVISGDGSTTRSYMHGRELGKYLWLILLRGERGEIYDVGSTIPTTMLELANKIIKRELSNSEIVIEGGIDPAPYYMPFDMEKTKKLISSV